MEVVFHRGVYLPEFDLWLDSLRKRQSAVISHAHSDHTARHLRPVITHNTGILLSDYLKNSDPILLDYHEPLGLAGCTVTLYPAGHCLGSAQVLVQSKNTGERLLYTGDIKTRPSPINEPLEPVPCDTLVLESTYGKPQYTFPCEKQVLETAGQTLRAWLSKGQRPVVQGWRLGKAQEVLYHLMDQGFDVMVEPSIHRVVQLYQQAEVVFPREPLIFNGEWPEGSVMLCPPGRRNTQILDGFRGKRFMELTGWATDASSPWGRRGDASLPFSDHPDFNDLVEYVHQVNPKQVYTVNGFPQLASHLRGLGIPAIHLDGKLQTSAGYQLKLM